MYNSSGVQRPLQWWAFLGSGPGGYWRGRSPVEYRGNLYVRLSVRTSVRTYVRPPICRLDRGWLKPPRGRIRLLRGQLRPLRGLSQPLRDFHQYWAGL